MNDYTVQDAIVVLLAFGATILCSMRAGMWLERWLRRRRQRVEAYLAAKGWRI